MKQSSSNPDSSWKDPCPHDPCGTFHFRYKSRWNSFGEIVAYTSILVLMGALDYGVTAGLVSLSLTAFWAKAWSNVVGFLANYFLRKFFVFGDWVN